MAEILERVNDLFGSDTREEGKFVYVRDTLLQQAVDKSKELVFELAGPGAQATERDHGCTECVVLADGQALESEKVRGGLKDVLLGPAQLYEALRAKAETSATTAL